MTEHEFTQGAPTTLDADEAAGERAAERAAELAADKALGRAPRTEEEVNAILGLDVDATDGNDLEAIRGELKAAPSTKTKTKTMEVEQRPGWTVEYRLDFTSKDIESVRKASADRSFSAKIDGIKYAALLLAKACVEVRKDGKRIPLPGGAPATFLEPEFLDLFKADDERKPVSAVEGVKRLYVLEGHLESTATTLMAAAGWGSEAREVDPTV